MKYVVLLYDLAYAYFYIHLLLHLKIESFQLQSNTNTVCSVDSRQYCIYITFWRWHLPPHAERLREYIESK